MTNAFRIGLVRYTNFGPFEAAQFDFSRPGLTVVEGEITWKPGSNSNGSGKSFLIDGVPWCLWGRCLRPDYRGDDVVRIGSKGGTCVITSIVGGDVPIEVFRYRQHPKHKNRIYVHVDGKDVTRGTDVETQAVVDHLLGMDFTTFQNSVAFGAREDVRSFFAAPDAQRKQVLDQMLGLTLYVDAEKEARRRVKDLGEQLGPLQTKASVLDGKLTQQIALLAQLRASGEEEELKLKRSMARAALAQREKAKALRKSDLSAAEADLMEELSKAETERHSWQTKYDDYLREKAKVDRVIREADRRVGATHEARLSAERALERHSEQDEKSCVMCKQPLPVAEYAKVTKALKAAVDKAVQEAEGELSSRKIANNALAALAPPAPLLQPAVELARSTVQAEREKYNESLGALRVAASEAESAETAYDRATSQVKNLDAQREQTAGELTAARDAISEKSQEADRVAFWVEAFGNQGLKSFLIESETSEINKRATGYAQRLLGQGTTVRLLATTQLKSSDATREKLTVEAKIPGCSVSYAGASKGQKRRLDLALLLAFRDLVADRSVGAFRQFFADELFDGLDQTGSECVVEMLREIGSNDCPVVLVTHNLQLKSAADRVVVVRHEKQYLATVSSGLKRKRLAAATAQ